MLRFPWQPYFDSFHYLKDGLTFFCSGNSYLIFDFFLPTLVYSYHPLLAV